jgi:superfamily II DNA or RNA helicase
MHPRPYQIEISNRAADIIKQYGLVYLAMQVRTGKTVTALLTAEKIGAGVILFLTKKKIITGILEDHKQLGLKADIIVTNYENIHKINQKFDIVICDEAHGLGQYPKPAQRVKKLKELCKGKPIIYLSGTPTPESYSQIFHQFYISSFSPFKDYVNFYKWAKDYVDIRLKYFKGLKVNDYSQANQTKIKQMTDHLIIPFTQAEAGFMAEVEELTIGIKMQGATYHLADKLKRERIYTGRDGKVILADTGAKLLSKLHQVYTGTVIDEKQEGVIFDRSKAYWIKENFKGKKIAIFYKYKAEEVMLHLTFGYDKFTTDPQEFAGSDNKWFLSQIQSGREGINLSTADALIMLNIDFSAVSYWQARARMQNKDRQEASKVYWLFAEGGIEEKIYNAVKDKKDYTLSYFKNEYGIE